MKVSVTRRNTIIELFRFLFTISVVIAHAVTSDFSWAEGIVCNGHIAVEFFFVLSGALMAKQCMKNREDNRPLAESTWSFLRSKITALAPVWYTLLIILTVQYVVQKPSVFSTYRNAYTFLTQLLQSYLFLSSYGMGTPVTISYSWYIPVMLVSMLILYPLIRRYGRKFTAIIAPLVVVFFCSWAIVTRGKLFMLADEMIGFVYPQQIRGLCELCAGCVAYEFSAALHKRLQGKLTSAGRSLITLLGVAMLLLPITFIFYGLSGKSHPAVLLMFAVGVGISFSGLDLSGNLPAIVQRVFAWLGKISLSVYLTQGLVLNYFKYNMQDSGSLLTYCLAAIVAGVAIHYLAQLMLLLFRQTVKLIRRVCILPSSEI